MRVFVTDADPRKKAKERPELTTTVRGTVDQARRLAAEHGRRDGRKLRNVSFGADGDILVYVQ